MPEHTWTPDTPTPSADDIRRAIADAPMSLGLEPMHPRQLAAIRGIASHSPGEPPPRRAVGMRGARIGASFFDELIDALDMRRGEEREAGTDLPSTGDHSPGT